MFTKYSSHIALDLNQVISHFNYLVVMVKGFDCILSYCIMQGQTRIAKGPYLPGLDPTRQGWTLLARVGPYSLGCAPSRQGATLLARVGPCSSGWNRAHQDGILAHQGDGAHKGWTRAHKGWTRAHKGWTRAHKGVTPPMWVPDRQV